MKEVEYIYFINGERVNREFINWENSTGFTLSGNQVHVDFEPEDLDIIYDWSEGVKDEQKESDLETLCSILSLAGMGAIPGVELKDNTLSNLVGRAESQAINASDYAAPDERASILTPQSRAPVGVKHNKFKAPLDIVQVRQFPKALQLIALATAFGNKKYEATDKDFLNFKRVAGGSQTYFDAAARHNAERNDVDEDSGLPHIIHAVWDSLAALEIWVEENDIDTKDFSKKYLEYLHK